MQMGKTKLKQTNKYSSETDTAMDYFKIILIILIIFAVFYVITHFVIKKHSAVEPEPTIQYTEVIAGNILNINNDEYYVLVEFEDDKYLPLYDTYLSKYSSKENSKPYYKVDMSKGFNKGYISNESKLDTDVTSEIRFSATTLLKIKSGKIVEKYETTEKITEVLEKL